jgi:hypothetical protein
MPTEYEMGNFAKIRSTRKQERELGTALRLQINQMELEPDHSA